MTLSPLYPNSSISSSVGASDISIKLGSNINFKAGVTLLNTLSLSLNSYIKINKFYAQCGIIF